MAGEGSWVGGGEGIGVKFEINEIKSIDFQFIIDHIGTILSS
jgi:hypothetical protein